MWKQLHSHHLKDPCILQGMGGGNCYTNKFLLLLRCHRKTACIHCSLLQTKQSKSLGSLHRLDNIKLLHAWNSVQHFRLNNSSLIKVNFSLKAALLNSWLTLHSGLFPTLTTCGYTYILTRNSCSGWLNSCFDSRPSVKFSEELLHWAEHQGSVCSNLHYKQLKLSLNPCYHLFLKLTHPL